MSLSLRRPDLRSVAGAALLTCVLVAQGVMLNESLIWAGPLICLLLVAVAVDVPIVPFLALVMLARVLTDGQSEEATRASASLGTSVLIAGLVGLVATGMLIRRTRGWTPFVAIGIGVAFWTGLAALHSGTEAVTLREGAREISILAMAVIAYNARSELSMPVVARIIQLAGIFSALLAIEQLATGSGMLIGGALRANGTFVHPNGAVVYFALAAVCSLWRYLDCGRSRLDLAFLVVFAAAGLATFSLDGFASLCLMLMAFGWFYTDSRQARKRALVLVAVLTAAFLVSPVGQERVSETLSNGVSAAETRGEGSDSLAWRLAKWESLIPEWERSPVIGIGLGGTITPKPTATNTTVGNLPHNEWLRYLVETGVVGVALILGGLIFLLRRFNRVRTTATGSRRAVAVLAMAVIIGLMVNGMASNTMLYTPSAFAAALIVASAFRVTAESADAALATNPRYARAAIATA